MSIDRSTYLKRIGLRETDISVTASGLALLQRSHLLTVPFENLDIHWKRPITIDTGRFYNKIVGEGRGGFCYELNGLFNELLMSLGFETRLISARVVRPDGTVGPEYDHAALIVTLDGSEYLADVGFGNFTTELLHLILDKEQKEDAGTFILRRFDDEYTEVAKREGDGWKRLYVFKDIARDLAEFAEMCDFQQYSPESPFTKSKICSILTKNGRKTLTDSKFIVKAGGGKTETAVPSEAFFNKTLESEFGIKAELFSANAAGQKT